jgi:prepilin-type N-terminal cleavage/methylation domain-containing protein/prepilin-type processing-associated H-X9-DG protein
MKRRRGFTLIELLVVIAVIAIIAAILFPVFAQAREKARQATCLSNCQQWGKAFMMYVQDHDETYPLAFGYDPGFVSGWAYNTNHMVPAGWRAGQSPRVYSIAPSSWANSVQPYLKNYGVYACPSAPESRFVGSLTDADLASALKPPVAVSYTFNGLLHGFPQAGVAAPSKLPLLSEGRGKAKQLGYALANPTLICADPAAPCRYIPRQSSAPPCAPGNGGTSNILSFNAVTLWIHNQGAIFVFADGSAKWRRLGATINGRNDPNVDPHQTYDNTGAPGGVWFDGCHVVLFRPDFQFQ